MFIISTLIFAWIAAHAQAFAQWALFILVTNSRFSQKNNRRVTTSQGWSLSFFCFKASVTVSHVHNILMFCETPYA